MTRQEKRNDSERTSGLPAPWDLCPKLGTGECATLMREVDWSRSALGPVAGWPLTLRSTVSTLLNSRHPMFLWWGPELIQFYNDAYRPSFGQGKHPQAMGQRAQECWPEIWDIIGPQIRDVMEHGTPSWHENQLVPIFRNGFVEDVYWTYGYSPVFDDRGSIGGTLVVCTETTELVRNRQANERLLAALEALATSSRLVAEAIPQQVWTADGDGELDFVNQRVVEYFGLDSATLLGDGWRSVIHPDDISNTADRWMTALQTGTDYETEFRLRRRDGSYRWHLARAVALRAPTERVVKWFGTNTDIDEAKRAGEDLRRRSEFGEQLVGIVSHDLRNPLHAILMGTHLLGHEPVDPRTAKTLSRIRSAGERASRMINDLLDFTQARLGHGLPIHRQKSNLQEICAGLLEELRGLHPDRAIAVRHGGDGDGEWDQDRVAQAITNLLMNAVSYSDPGTQIDLTTQGAPEKVTIEVHNLGLPIPPSVLPTLFEPMKRGTRDGDRSVRSIGLGLYIVKEIVTRHGGSVSVTSTPEAGTTFRLELPRRAPPPL